MSKILCFLNSEQINITCQRQRLTANNRFAIVLSFSHRVCFLINIFGKLPFSHKSDHKKEKNVVSFTHEQNIICCQTQLDDIAHEQAIICGLLFTGHMVGSRPMKRKQNLHRMITIIRAVFYSYPTWQGIYSGLKLFGSKQGEP